MVLRDLQFQEHRELTPERIPGTQRTKDPFSSGFATINATPHSPKKNVAKKHSAPRGDSLKTPAKKRGTLHYTPEVFYSEFSPEK